MTIITSEAHDAIRAAAQGHLRDEGRRRPDGTWDVNFGADVVERLEGARFPGETISDTIVRLVALSDHKPN